RDPAGELVAPVVLLVVPAARVAARVGHALLGAAQHHLAEAQVVAADADGDQRGVRGERVELRRVGLAERELLRLGHVLGDRARAARVGEVGGAQRLGDPLRVVVGGPQAEQRVASGDRDERAGGEGVAQGDVAVGQVRLVCGGRRRGERPGQAEGGGGGGDPAGGAGTGAGGGLGGGGCSGGFRRHAVLLAVRTGLPP